MSGRNIKVGFISSENVRNRNTWSGIPSFIADAVSKNIGEVKYFGPVRLRLLFGIGDRINRLLKAILNKRYHYSWSVLVSLIYASIFKKKLKNEQLDVLITTAGYTEIAFLKTNIPIIYCCDSTLNLVIDYYPGLSNLLEISKKELNYIEKRAIDKASIIVYSSRWAADNAIKFYKADPAKVFVIPFGANITNIPSRGTIKTWKKNDSCRLLFLGVNWERKGGELAFETMIELNRMGLSTTLTVCGCVPPNGVSHSNLRNIPFLDKNDPEQLEQFENLFLNNDFLILPTRQECYGIVFCEASAYGLPSFSTNTGGVSGVIEEGINGFLLPINATALDFAKKIYSVFQDESKYNTLRETSRNLFETKLNWDIWAKRLEQVLQQKNLIK